MKNDLSNFIVKHTNIDSALIAGLCVAFIGILWAIIRPGKKGQRPSILEETFKKSRDGKISQVTLLMEIIAGIVCIVFLGEWFIHNANVTSLFDLVCMGLILALAIYVSWRIVLWSILKDRK